MKVKSYEDLLQAELTVSLGGQTLQVSVFLIDHLLIDTGPNRKQKSLISLFEQWDINDVILTHHHEDHTGLAYWLKHNKDATIHMHPLGATYGQKKARLPLYRRVFWGKRPAFHAKELSDTFQSEHYVWEVIHTPGHADDHIALYNKEKGWLFGGDLYVHPKPKSMFKFESVPKLIHSLRKVLAYDFDTYICSHAGVIFNGKKALKTKLDYLISLQQEVLFLHNKGMTRKQVRQELFPKKHMMHYISFFENSPRHFIDSIIDQK
ncbi:MBL fold metallo-hydrolase [Pseudogracilibacillus auburnensis]|uniref:Glyoxylase-like metal-dependent hydrolase (Beta-lactamase superfamily II) n=1 Tax=Pseudogracilibacillus auburnensis TaxID=1494959 RepID=A0A2V3VWJ4_9BACI|nr:MBL fold metallo-hydrolase [Pseudogracilibacillus auburnensis]MBO1002286.1 MBL fold metallo-hydrolase [Pseudogracilibacillus auburnensis]PXW86327.1 glyoxylase-like metal-dependent hydrolase (beta-lactamase superfamily II) [Pseudogracilibacillus auburnensis]